MTTPYWKLISEYGVKAGERIADLERDLENAKLPRGQFVPGRVTDIINPAEPYILRKQAEAVDEVNRRLTTLADETSERMDSQLVSQYCASISGEEAQRLRQQADELERKQ